MNISVKYSRQSRVLDGPIHLQLSLAIHTQGEIIEWVHLHISPIRIPVEIQQDVSCLPFHLKKIFPHKDGREN